MLKRRFGSKAGNADFGRSRADDSNRSREGDASREVGQPEQGTEAIDRYERSSERRETSSRRGGFRQSGQSRADAKSFAPARRVFKAADEGSALSDAEQIGDVAPSPLPQQSPARKQRRVQGAQPTARRQDDYAATQAVEPDRAARLDRARALLQQTTARIATQPLSETPSTPGTARIDDPFQEADPFEPFEQCAPSSSPEAQGDVVRSRPARRQRKAPSNRQQPQRSSGDASFEDADPFEQCVPLDAPEGDPDCVYSRSSQRQRKTADANNPRRPQRSLKGRALGYLSRREYSRAELSRKLRPYVEEADSLETLLDGLERDGWLSNERFVESVVHRRAALMGGSRIISELKRHAVGDALIGETAGKLAQTETARAQAVWQKKYGVLPETPAERAKQARFLAARGFSGSTIGKILKGGDEDCADEFIDD
ncbi:recombination regulator RecX [Caballeronia concitans]|uniref:Regulatory protein RecX n=1 Tax=Caballeronia concitans TaxID=1777133 RepID=A0A658QRR0_9BURK|nr:Regulatory protein recX [Burkholderia sp. MR1]SAL14525.1 recombination regulator RecX [Caballeronia concitans]